MKVTMRKLATAGVTLLALIFVGSAIAGHLIAPNVLHPFRAPLDAGRLASVDEILARTHGTRADFDVRARDGATLRGWKMFSAAPNGDWVILLHGMGDNRSGMAAFADFLLPAGYNVVMMDSRAQGASGGDFATYGWQERYDTSAIIDALYSTERVRHIFALGVSMGAAIALQSAGIEPRIRAVVAEDPFANLREVSYDYAGLHWSPMLGKTLFWPASFEAMRTLRATNAIEPDEVSPEKAVASRPFPVLLICGTADHTIPCRHAEMIYRAARGPKESWEVQGAPHAGAYGQSPTEYERRVLTFFANNDR
jgi:uncharacterized protein